MSYDGRQLHRVRGGALSAEAFPRRLLLLARQGVCENGDSAVSGVHELGQCAVSRLLAAAKERIGGRSPVAMVTHAAARRKPLSRTNGDRSTARAGVTVPRTVLSLGQLDRAPHRDHRPRLPAWTITRTVGERSAFAESRVSGVPPQSLDDQVVLPSTSRSVAWSSRRRRSHTTARQSSPNAAGRWRST